MSEKCPLDGYALDIDTDWLGRTVTLCLGCDRKAGRVCLDCTTWLPRPSRKGGGKAARCPICRRARRRLTNHRSHRRRQVAKGRPTNPSPGRCSGCATPIGTGRQMWCPACAKVQRRVWDRARYARDKAKRLAECRRRYWADPERKREGARATYRRNIVAIKRRRFGQNAADRARRAQLKAAA